MLFDPSAPVLRFLQRAAKIYLRYYGAYPEVIGLDVFTRFREWQETGYLDAYHFREVALPPPHTFHPNVMCTVTNIAIKIDPVTFSRVLYNEYRMNPRPTDPTQGENGVWCKRGEHEVAMDLRITESGYHAIISERSDLDAWHSLSASCASLL